MAKGIAMRFNSQRKFVTICENACYKFEDVINKIIQDEDTEKPLNSPKIQQV